MDFLVQAAHAATEVTAGADGTAAQAAQTAFDKTVFIAGVGFTAFGGVLLAALAGTSRDRNVVGAAIGVVAGLLLSTLAGAAGSRETLQVVVPAVIAGGALGAFATWLLDRAFQVDMVASLIPFDRSGLRPSAWDVPGAATTDDMARRWFVTLAAGIGGVIGALVFTGNFVETLREAITATGIVAALVLTIAGVTFVGPFHDFVLSAEHGEGHGHQALAHLMSGRAGWRAWLRLGLVALLLLALELPYVSLDHSIQHGDPDMMTKIVVAGITPAVVSYYLSAALQLGASDIADRAGWASIEAGAVLNYGIALVVVGVWIFDNTTDNKTLIIVPIVAVVVALLWSLIVCGIYAIAAGWVLERMRGWPAMGGVAVALAACFTVDGGLRLLVTWLLGARADPWSVVSMLGGIVFWWIGLVASGFPKLVMKPLAAAPAETDPQAQGDRA